MQLYEQQAASFDSAAGTQSTGGHLDATTNLPGSPDPGAGMKTTEGHRHDLLQGARSALIGLLTGWLGRLAYITVSLALTPYVLARVGTEAYGLWALLCAVSSYYALTDFGLLAACTKHLAEGFALRSRDHVEAYLSAARSIYAWLCVGLIPVGTLIAFCLPWVFQLPPHHATAAVLAGLLTTGSVVLRLQTQPAVAIVRANNRADLSNATAVAAQFGQAALTFFFVTLHPSVVSLALANFLSAAAGRLVSAGWARHLCRRTLDIRLPRLSLRIGTHRTALRHLFRFSAYNVVRQVVPRFATTTLEVLLGALLGLADLAYYKVAQSVVTKAGSLTGGLGQVLLPLASQVAALRDRRAMQMLVGLPEKILAIIGWTAVGFLLGCSEVFLHLWVGPEIAAAGTWTLRILALGLGARYVTTGLRDVMAGAGHIRLVAAVSTSEGVGRLLLGLCLALWLGIDGAALGTTAVNFAATAAILGLAARWVDFSWRRYLTEVCTPGLIALVACLSMTTLSVRWWSPTHLVQVLLLGAAVVVPVSALCLAIFLNSDEKRLLRRLLRGR
jgi:O-antigen/teichoic acid export membrane protein